MDSKLTYKQDQWLARFLSARWILPIMVAVAALLIGLVVMHAFSWNLSIPWKYPRLAGDQVWQLTLTKTLVDNGWILNSKYLGAPGIAQWYANPAAQTSSLHSVLMLGLSLFIGDAVRIQQVYFLLNFPLIALTSYLACRLLGIFRVPSAAVALLFPFLTYRFNLDIYAYLPNYFAVPLAIVPIYWILRGDYAAEAMCGTGIWRGIRASFSSRKFWLGAMFVTLMALSDGYYAFFTLLLLGFAVGARLVCGDMRRLMALLAPVTLIAILMAVALAMTWPLIHYKNTHHGEFYPNGRLDSTLIKQPFEAEVYSSNLKLLLAPAPSIERVPWLAELGQKMLDSTNGARLYKVADQAPLGLLASMLLLASLALTVVALTGRKPSPLGGTAAEQRSVQVLWVSVALSLFIFLCVTAGGIGALIALVYPAIRAYDRFTIFLIFVLYMGGAAALTTALAHANKAKRIAWVGLVGIICVLSLLDQIPTNAFGGTNEGRTRYLAERAFVHKVETSLPTGSMVYNYPYSQYLTNSKYYGWGGFSHIRLYLHSHKLRWSNGASKNSPVDDWQARMAGLPAAQLIVEMRAVGFRGMVIDRTVVGNSEYDELASVLKQETGRVPETDKASELAFITLNNPGYRVTYDATFSQITRMTVFDRKLTLAARLPMLVNRSALEKVLADSDNHGSIVVDSATHPDVFLDPKIVEQGLGDYIIKPLEAMKGSMQCSLASGASSAGAKDTVVLRLTNKSSFDWLLNSGKFPLGVGVNLYQPDGSLASWDKGIRYPGKLRIEKGTTTDIRFPISLIDDKLSAAEKHNYIIQFKLVQDGNAWFNDIGCRVPLSQ